MSDVLERLRNRFIDPSDFRDTPYLCADYTGNAVTGKEVLEAMDEIKRLRAENKQLRSGMGAQRRKTESLRARVTELEETFRHTHVAKYDKDNMLIDACGKCGLGLRDAVHVRVPKSEKGGKK